MAAAEPASAGASARQPPQCPAAQLIASAAGTFPRSGGDYGARARPGPGVSRNQKLWQAFCYRPRGEPSEADMLLMCLSFVIYSASMQMFLDSLSPAPSREHDARANDDR